MTIDEFNGKLPDGARIPDGEEFSIIQYVYDYHPAFDGVVEAKRMIAELYATYGMCIIRDMVDTARRVSEIMAERRKLRNQLDALDDEYRAIKRGEEYQWN